MSLLIKNAALAIGEMEDEGMGPVIAEATFENEENAIIYATVIEVEGVPNFYVGDRSLIVCFTEPGDNSWVEEYMKKNALPLTDYFDIYEDEEIEGTDLYYILLYLTYLVRCPAGEDEAFINETVGYPLGSVEIPTTDVEEEYWAMKEAEEAAAAEEERLENAPLMEVSPEMHEFFELVKRVHQLNEEEKARYLALQEILG